MAASVNIQVSANAQGVYDEIVRQARRAEAIVKKIPLRIETKDLQGFKTLTADIDRFDKSVSRMSAVIVTFGQAAALIFGVQNAFAALIKTSISVEKKLNDINAIAQGSATSLQKLSDGLFNIAKQTGQSFDVAATAAQEFSRQGLSVGETLKRTRDALTLTRIAGLDAAKATQSLTAIFNTFNKEALDTTKITNTLANVDTKFAVSAADLTQALSRAGASAADAKVPFNELVAAVTSLQQTTARGGNVIGNSLKSIFTRLQRNDTVQALREIGVEVRDTEGNIRPLMTVLTELSKTFYTLGDAQKASIKEQVAGVYQINQLSALLADLSGGYSTYTNALNTANKTQNEAVDRLEILKNSTAGSLNDMMANLTQFAGDFGKVFTKPLVKNPIDILNSVFDFTKGFADSEDVGAKIGKGLIQGLGTFLGSGGTVLLSKSLFNIGRLVVEGVKDQLFAATTLNRTSEKHLQLQEQIKAVLLTQDSLVQSRIAAANNEAERQKIVLSIIEDQTAAMIRLNSIAGKAATNILQSGYKGPVDAVLKRSASGYLPSMMAEKAAVNSGVGGANRNAKPVVIPNFNLGGGKRETIVANSSEYLVPNFAGGSGSAIFNQDMIKKFGLPSGAQKIMAGGHIPNFRTNKEIELFRGLSKYGNKELQNISTEDAPPIQYLNPLDYAKFKDKSVKGKDIYGKEFYSSRRILKEFLKKYPDKNYFERLLYAHTGSSVPGLVSFSTNKEVAKEFATHIEQNPQPKDDRKLLYSILFPKSQIISSQKRFDKILNLPSKEKKELLRKGLGININRILKGQSAFNNAESEVAIFTKDIMQYAPARALSKGHIPNFVFGGKKARNPFLEFFSPLDGKPRFEIKSPKNLFSNSGTNIEEILNGKSKSYLGDIISHKELFDQYPFLEDLLVSFLPKNSRDYGSFSGIGPFGKIKLNKNLSRDNAAATLIHELQHSIQSVEGTFPGDDKLYNKFQGKNYAKYRLIPSEIEAITAQKRFENPDFQKEHPDLFTSRVRKMLSEGGGHLNFGNGHIPNFNPLLASLKREASSLQSLGYSKDQIFSGLKVQSSPTLKNNSNPTGLGVFNTLQGQNSIGKALSDHRGENLQRAGIPNFATPQQAVNDIFSNLRKIRGSAYERGTNLPLQFGKSGTKQGFVEAATQMEDLAKDTKLLRSVLPKLIASIEKEIKQIDATIATGNLNLETEKRLNSQKDYLKKSLDRGLSLSSNDPRLLRNTTIRGSLTSRAERVQRANEERLFAQRATQAKAEEELAKQDRLKSERRQKFQNGLLLSFFAIPFVSEIGSNLLGGEKTRGGRIASGIGGPLSAGLSLATFGGPLGVAAGLGVAGLGIGKTVLGNKDVKGFSDRFTAKDQLQTALDSLNAQQETFGQFQDAFIKFTDAKGADKEIAGQNLSRVIGTFADKKVGSELSSVAFGGGSLDEKLQKQIEIQQRANLSKQTEANIQAFKTLYDEAITGSSLLNQWNDKVDIAPEKVSKFAKLLSDTVDITKVSGPIDNKFLNDLLKKSGTGIENQKDNIGVTRIISELQYNLEQSKNAFDFTKGQAAKIEKSKFDIDKSKTGFSAILNQKDFINRLGLDSFKARLESPIFDAGTRKTLENQASRNEIAAGFEEGINKIRGRFVETVTGDKANVSYTKQVNLLNDLLKSSESNNIEDVVKQLETANETFKEIKDKTELKDIYNSFKELLQNSANQLTQQKKIAEIQERNNNDQRLLTLFDKLGLAGAENKGRISGDAILKLGLKKEQIRTTGLLSPDIETKAARENRAKIEEAKAFIEKTKIEKESLNGAAFSDKRKAELEQRLRESFTSVTKAGSIEDIRGSVDSIRSRFGGALNFETRDFEKSLQTGDTGAISKAFPIFQKRALSQLGNTNLDTKSNRGILTDLLSNTGGFVGNLSKIEGVAGVKTLETLGGTKNDSGLTAGDQFKETLGVLEESTKTFASSAAELAKAITNEKLRNEDLSKIFKISSIKDEIAKAQNERGSISNFSQKVNRDVQREMMSFLNLSITKPTNAEKFKYTGVVDAAGAEMIANSDSEIKNNRQKQIEDFYANPSSQNSKDFASKFPTLSKALVEEKDGASEAAKNIENLTNKIKELNLELEKTSTPIQPTNPEVPTNFDPYAAAIRRAKMKEHGAGIPHSQIYTSRDRRLISHSNPLGIGVANYLDEPNGIHQGINRKIRRGKNPRLSEGGVPNFASDKLDKIMEELISSQENNKPNPNASNYVIPGQSYKFGIPEALDKEASLEKKRKNLLEKRNNQYDSVLYGNSSNFNPSYKLNKTQQLIESGKNLQEDHGAIYDREKNPNFFTAGLERMGYNIRGYENKTHGNTAQYSKDVEKFFKDQKAQIGLDYIKAGNRQWESKLLENPNYVKNLAFRDKGWVEKYNKIGQSNYTKSDQPSFTDSYDFSSRILPNKPSPISSPIKSPEQLAEEEQFAIFDKLAAKKKTKGVFDKNGDQIFFETREKGSIYDEKGLKFKADLHKTGKEESAIFKKLHEKQARYNARRTNSAIQETSNQGLYNNPEYSRPVNSSTQSVSQNSGVDTSSLEAAQKALNQAQELLAKASSISANITSRLSFDLNGGVSKSVNDIATLKEEIVQEIKDWVNQNKVLEGGKRNIV